jgi:AmmeMemoRadiSam system protein B
MSSRSYARGAAHAGSWYSDDEDTLAAQLEGWLRTAAAADHAPHSDLHTPDGPARCRGVIAPHAGYRYSGPTAAHAYTHLAAALSPSPRLRTYRR